MMIAALLLALAGLAGVQAQDTPNILATTSIVADVAQNIAGARLTIEMLIPPDADAHAFEPSISDAGRVAAADLVLAVGVGYEAFLADLIETAGSQAQVVILSNGVDILGYAEHGHDGEAAATEPHEHAQAEVIGVLGSDALECAVEGSHEDGEWADEAHEHGPCDPHVWMNPRNVIAWANHIAAALSAADPANADAYRANADAYVEALQALDAEISSIVAAVPEERRVLITNHEFLAYFAAAYGFEVIGTILPGATTDAEPDPQQITALIAQIREEGVPAIFAEVTANAQLAEVVAQEAGIQVVTALYSEALSAADGPAGSYLDFMRYNAQTIADALTASG
jgi:ABC-type Zn uptake system ZnuABC Zn-binding protein ZnuA